MSLVSSLLTSTTLSRMAARLYTVRTTSTGNFYSWNADEVVTKNKKHKKISTNKQQQQHQNYY